MSRASAAFVLQTAGIGDLLFTQPLLDSLSRHYGRVVLVAAPAAHRLARRLGVEVICDDKRGTDSGPRGLQRLVTRLRAAGARHADLLVAHRSVRSALVARAVGGHRRFGFADAPRLARLAYSDVVPVRPLDTDRYLALAAAAGIPVPIAPALCLPVGDAEREARRAQLPGSAARLGLVLGSRRPTKDWPELHLIAAARHAARFGFHGVTLLGGPGERERASRIRVALGRPASCFDATGEELDRTVSTVAALDAVIGPDSGLTHLARAVATPAVVLFGPTDPQRHAPQREAGTGMWREGLSCRPCHHAGPRRCPRGDLACLQELRPEQALARARDLLLSRTRSAPARPQSPGAAH